MCGCAQRSAKELSISSLGELTPEEFEEAKHLIRDEVRVKRAKHAVYENQRTIAAVKALKEGDITKFGELMNQSHVSLRDDYEVSCKEIDLLVDLSWNTPGVIGSRITGGGFGGCTVSIVKMKPQTILLKMSERPIKKNSDMKLNFMQQTSVSALPDQMYNLP